MEPQSSALSPTVPPGPRGLLPGGQGRGGCGGGGAIWASYAFAAQGGQGRGGCGGGGAIWASYAFAAQGRAGQRGLWRRGRAGGGFRQNWRLGLWANA